MVILDFNIQLGKFFYSSSSDSLFWKIFPAILSGLISLGIAYFIFWKGQRTTKIKEQERLKEVREYFYITLLKFKLGVNTQIELFDTQIKNLTDDRNNHVSIFRPASFSYVSTPTQLLSISKNDTFKFFIQNRNDKKYKRIESYSTFYDLLLLMEKIFEQLEDENSNTLKKYEIYQNKIEENKDKIADMIAKASHKSYSEGKEIISDDPYYSKMSEAYINYNKNANGTLEPIINELINPIMNISFEDFFSHSDSPTILTLCKNANYYYGKIFEDKRVDLEIIKHWNKFYIEMKDIITIMIDLEFKDIKYDENIFLSK